MTKTYCLNNYSNATIEKVKKYIAKSIIALEQIKLQEHVDTIIERIRHKEMRSDDKITFTLQWETEVNNLLIAAGLAILNEKEDTTMNKLGGACSECGSLNGNEHAKHCSQYPMFLFLNEDTNYKHPWTDELMELEEIQFLSPVDTTAYDFPHKRNSAPKDKTGKPNWSVFPFSEAEEVLKAFEYGASKYGRPFSYREGNGIPLSDLYSATMRHLIATQKGETQDKESNCLHWACVASTALMAIAALRKVKV